MNPKRFGNGVPGSEARVERGDGILEDHLQPEQPGTRGSRVKPAVIAALKHNLPG
jgi:hypothetical protein